MNAIDWLVVTVLFSALLWVPYVMERMVVRGIWGALQNPSPTDPQPRAWARRAAAAHENALHNIPLFAALVLASAVKGLEADPLVVGAAQGYLFARIAHYCVYSAGIPVLRTVAFIGGWVAVLVIGFQVLL